MRKSPLYILTADLSFFYRINKELNILKIPFKILNLNTIPRTPSIILTTSKEMDIIKDQENSALVLAYSEGEDFDKYIIKTLAAVKIGYKKEYSELLFSLDPGKKTGLMIFLDGFYLYSYCCFDSSEVIRKIVKYVEVFKSGSQNDINMIIKIGNGVLAITMDLVKQFYSIFADKKNLKIIIIDEFKSSKLRINKKKKPKRISKDELSALLLALRNGVEINEKEYVTLIKQSYKNRINNNRKDREILKDEEASYNKPNMGDIALKIIDGKITLRSASEELKVWGL